jgi:transcriptional regulator with XRE-family HTH domain
MDYIQKIKELILIKKISQRELARVINKTHATINNYITGKTIIDVNTLIEIANALNVHPCVFFREDEKVKTQINGNYNNIGNGNGNSIIINNLEKEVENLKERIADKEKIIQEKERTIEILMKSYEKH